jgi:hypothetical protein
MQTPFSGSGVPQQVHGVLLHTMSGTELPRVRTELERRRIFTSIPPHPVQTEPRQTLIVFLESFYQSVHAIPPPLVSTSVSKNNISVEIALKHRQSISINQWIGNHGKA